MSSIFLARVLLFLGSMLFLDIADEENYPNQSDFILIKGGYFEMGSDTGNNNQRPKHKVYLSDFKISKYEVTVGEFRQFINETGYVTDAEKNTSCIIWDGNRWIRSTSNWRYDARGKLIPENKFNFPVIHITYNDAIEYCKWLSNKTKKSFRLPTEAEWEFAASSRGKFTYGWGDEWPAGNKKYGNVSDVSAMEYRKKEEDWFYLKDYNDGFPFTAPVGSFHPNELGLYDMSGNVWELCLDYYDEDYYSKSTGVNPPGPKQGEFRIKRGGSYFSLPYYVNVKARGYIKPDEPRQDVGFRLVMDIN